jgi:hypothetical protein
MYFVERLKKRLTMKLLTSFFLALLFCSEWLYCTNPYQTTANGGNAQASTTNERRAKKLFASRWNGTIKMHNKR